MFHRQARIFAVLATALLCAVGCPSGRSNVVPPTVAPNLYVTSVSQAGPLAGLARSFTQEPVFSHGATYIISGPPEYLLVTLRTIELSGDFVDGSSTFVLWSGSQEIVLDGTPVDTASIQAGFLPVPLGHVTSIRADFDSVARIRGTVSGPMALSDGTVFDMTANTKRDYAYDAFEHTGGAASYALYQEGTAEETEVCICGGIANEALDLTLSEDMEPPTLSLVFDLNRVLRFYNGQHPDPAHGGVNPTDPTDRAYFFAHTFTPAIIFVGLPGRIDGCAATYAVYDASDPIGSTTPYGVRAWMTVVYGQAGGFQSGSLIGDDDNDLTIAKGSISLYEQEAGGSVSFAYAIDQVDARVEGFRVADALGDPSAVCLFAATSPSWSCHGEAQFVLRLRQ